jgi:hypothetical protein
MDRTSQRRRHRIDTLPTLLRSGYSVVVPLYHHFVDLRIQSLHLNQHRRTSSGPLDDSPPTHLSRTRWRSRSRLELRSRRGRRLVLSAQPPHLHNQAIQLAPRQYRRRPSAAAAAAAAADNDRKPGDEPAAEVVRHGVLSRNPNSSPFHLFWLVLSTPRTSESDLKHHCHALS